MRTVRLIREVTRPGGSGPWNGQYALQKALRDRLPDWLHVGGMLREGEIPWVWCWEDREVAAGCAAAGQPFIVGPNVAVLVFLGGAAALSGLAINPLGQLLAWGAYLPLTWTTRVVQWTARFPYASVPFALSDLGLVAIYGAIAGLTGIALLAPERRNAFLQSARSQIPFKVAAAAL